MKTPKRKPKPGKIVAVFLRPHGWAWRVDVARSKRTRASG